MNWLRTLGVTAIVLTAAACNQPSTSTSTTATPLTIREETDQETRERVTRQLKEAGYKRSPADETKFPADFTHNNGSKLHMSAEYPAGDDYFLVVFPDGKRALCDQPGIGAAGVQPAGEIDSLRTLGYDKVVGSAEQPTCKAA